MDIPVNSDVQCVDGAGGRSSYVIINKTTGEVSHIVVETQAFPRVEHVVPVDLIRESTPQRIELRCTVAELYALPPYVELEYQRGEDARDAYSPGQWLFAPGANPVPSAVPLEHKNIPENTLALRRGARVQATDGAIGSVADLVVDPVNSQLTHLILRVGGLFSPRQVTIKADRVDHISEDTVFLNVDRHAIDELPDVPVQR